MVWKQYQSYPITSLLFIYFLLAETFIELLEWVAVESPLLVKQLCRLIHHNDGNQGDEHCEMYQGVHRNQF